MGRHPLPEVHQEALDLTTGRDTSGYNQGTGRVAGVGTRLVRSKTSKTRSEEGMRSSQVGQGKVRLYLK